MFEIAGKSRASPRTSWLLAAEGLPDLQQALGPDHRPDRRERDAIWQNTLEKIPYGQLPAINSSPIAPG
ncbi:MAG: hypothetical protein WBN56_10870, partial [Robiginitalea sp.]|uniref:hypothetical protein n=1 Tax=Robiginitalea sp. TaxID=1902411 RepID=UPI003C72CAD4